MGASATDPGCDGLDTFELFVLVQRARLAYPTLLPPPSADLVRFRLETLRADVRHNQRCGGVGEVL